MWLILIVFSVFWIAAFRRTYSWGQTLATLAIPLAVLVPLAAWGPGWLWKTLMMAYLTFPYWLLPMTATRQPVTRATTVLRDFDPENDDLWPGLPGIVAEAAAGLEAEGIIRIGMYREDLPAGPATLSALYESADGADLVTVNGSTMLIGAGSEAETRDTQVNTIVAMSFADGRRLAVSNTALMPSGGPGTTVERFTGVDDPARLLRVARAYRARWFADARPVPVRGDTPPLRFWAERHQQSLARQASGPLYRLASNGDLYVTAAGAVIMGWGFLFPFRQIGEMRLRSRERRILRELGMNAADGAPFPRPRPQAAFDVQCAAALVIGILLAVLG